jgi:hypothetical protein
LRSTWHGEFVIIKAFNALNPDKIYISAMIFRFIISTLILLMVPGLAFSGSVKGKITYSSKFAPPDSFDTGKYKNTCGANVPNEKLLVKDKGLMNVVVSIKGNNLSGTSGEYKLELKDCRYTPHVIAMMKDSLLIIHSSDPVTHHLHSYPFDHDPVKISFSPNQDDYYLEIEEPGIVKVECDLHGWMTAWVVVTENPFFHISGEEGTFLITDIPAGTYTINAWHEILGSKSQTVTVGEGNAEINFDFSDTAHKYRKNDIL